MTDRTATNMTKKSMLLQLFYTYCIKTNEICYINLWKISVIGTDIGSSETVLWAKTRVPEKTR